MPAEFRNEPLTDFSKPENRKSFEAALARVQEELGREHPLIIGGEKIRIGKTFDSINPSEPSQNRRKIPGVHSPGGGARRRRRREGLRDLEARDSFAARRPPVPDRRHSPGEEA